MQQKTIELQEKFIEWLLLPDSRRGEVQSEAEWARRMGVTDRTLRRWKSLDTFNAMLERARAGLPVEKPQPATEAPVDIPEGVTGDEADYRVVKAALVEGAKGGNPKYLDLYFKTYGKPFVEEEVASRATDLAGMDLDDLVVRALSAVSTDAIVAHLRTEGWSVVRSSGDGSARS